MPVDQSMDEADSDISGLSERLRRMQATGDAAVAVRVRKVGDMDSHHRSNVFELSALKLCCTFC